MTVFSSVFWISLVSCPVNWAPVRCPLSVMKAFSFPPQQWCFKPFNVFVFHHWTHHSKYVSPGLSREQRSHPLIVCQLFLMESRRLLCHKNILLVYNQLDCTTAHPGPFLQSCFPQSFLVHGDYSSPGAELDISLIFELHKNPPCEICIPVVVSLNGNTSSWWQTLLLVLCHLQMTFHTGAVISPILYFFWHFCLDCLLP